ncbi:hypothetical protein D3C87_1885100 [compost metagenome]
MFQSDLDIAEVETGGECQIKSAEVETAGRILQRNDINGFRLGLWHNDRRIQLLKTRRFLQRNALGGNTIVDTGSGH